MKNIIFIDVDTDREQTIRFGKPEESFKPENPEDASTMLLNDIACISEALTTLILIADQTGFADKTELVHAVVKTIYAALADDNIPTESEKPNEP